MKNRFFLIFVRDRIKYQSQDCSSYLNDMLSPCILTELRLLQKSTCVYVVVRGAVGLFLKSSNGLPEKKDGGNKHRRGSKMSSISCVRSKSNDTSMSMDTPTDSSLSFDGLSRSPLFMQYAAFVLCLKRIKGNA